MSSIAAPVGVRFEHHTDDGPVLGIGTSTPRLSWIVPAADPAFAQEAYEVEIARAAGEADLFRVASSEQVLVPWPAPPLASREAARNRARVAGGGTTAGRGGPAGAEGGVPGAA